MKWLHDLLAKLDEWLGRDVEPEDIEELRAAIRGMEAKMASQAQLILDKVREQTTLLQSLVVFVQSLKDNANDPAKVAQIISELDANDAVIAALQNTPQMPEGGIAVTDGSLVVPGGESPAAATADAAASGSDASTGEGSNG